MMTDWLTASLSSGSPVALPLSFAAGILMGLNPCCLAMYPAAAATCCAGSCSPDGPPVVHTAGLFVLGNAIAITTLGLVAASSGRVLAVLGSGWLPYVLATVPLLMGLHLLGWMRIPVPTARWNRQAGRGRMGAFTSGLFLSLVISPCGTPVVAAILAYAAIRGSLTFAAGLLFLYGLGNGVPLLLVGTAAGGIARRLNQTGWTRWVERGAGLAMIGLGFMLLWTAK
jgi:cytochrome c-type biogenesis protein